MGYSQFIGEGGGQSCQGCTSARIQASISAYPLSQVNLISPFAHSSLTPCRVVLLFNVHSAIYGFCPLLYSASSCSFTWIRGMTVCMNLGEENCFSGKMTIVFTSLWSKWVIPSLNEKNKAGSTNSYTASSSWTLAMMKVGGSLPLQYTEMSSCTVERGLRNSALQVTEMEQDLRSYSQEISTGSWVSSLLVMQREILRQSISLFSSDLLNPTSRDISSLMMISDFLKKAILFRVRFCFVMEVIFGVFWIRVFCLDSTRMYPSWSELSWEETDWKVSKLMFQFQNSLAEGFLQSTDSLRLDCILSQERLGYQSQETLEALFDFGRMYWRRSGQSTEDYSLRMGKRFWAGRAVDRAWLVWTLGVGVSYLADSVKVKGIELTGTILMLGTISSPISLKDSTFPCGALRLLELNTTCGITFLFLSS